MEIFNSSYIGKAYIAQLVFEEIKDSIFIVFGGTSPWQEESVPPPSSSYLSNLPDAFLYVKANRVFLVREDNEGELSSEDKRYLELPVVEGSRRIRETRPNAIYAEFIIPSTAIQSIDPSINNYRTSALYHSVSWRDSVDLSSGWTTSTPKDFIMDKALFFSPRSVTSIDGATITFVKRF